MNRMLLTAVSATMISLLCSGESLGAINSWIAKGDNNIWEKDANWSLGRQPIEGDDVRIPAGSGTITVTKSLVVDANGKVKAAPKKMKSLTVGSTKDRVTLIKGADRHPGLPGLAANAPVDLRFVVAQDFELGEYGRVEASDALPKTDGIGGGQIEIRSRNGGISLAAGTALKAGTGSQEVPNSVTVYRGDGGNIKLVAEKGSIKIAGLGIVAGDGGRKGLGPGQGGQVLIQAKQDLTIEGTAKEEIAGQLQVIEVPTKIFGGTSAKGGAGKVVLIAGNNIDAKRTEAAGGGGLQELLSEAGGGSLYAIAGKELSVGQKSKLRGGFGPVAGDLYVLAGTLQNQGELSGGSSEAHLFPAPGWVAVILTGNEKSVLGKVAGGNNKIFPKKPGEVRVFSVADLILAAKVFGEAIVIKVGAANNAGAAIIVKETVQLDAQSLICLEAEGGTIDFSDFLVVGDPPQLKTNNGFIMLSGSLVGIAGNPFVKEDLEPFVRGEIVVDDQGCAPAVCDPDLNADGVVDGADLGILEALWGLPVELGDLTGDGLIDADDLGLLLAAWGDCPA